jgi:hypothetical protein
MDNELMRKVAVFTLNIGDYAPAIREITYPLMRYFAHKIKAEFKEITGRKYPLWPVVYEKLQIHQLGRGYDWIYFFDADCMIHPECIDFTWHLKDDECAHNGKDFAGIRFRYDENFAKDGRNIGTCGWLTIAPKKCIDIWTPTEQSVEEVIDCGFPTVGEMNSGLIDKGHLADDYVMSRNIARLGIKHTTIKELLPKIGLPDADFFWHVYTVPVDEKVRQMRETLRRWQIPDSVMRV